MSESEQPRRASLEYLKKLAKKRLDDLRRANSHAKLAEAQLQVAREAGFASWRQLKAEFDQRDMLEASPFFFACAAGDVTQVRKLLMIDKRLANAIDPDPNHRGMSALHIAVRSNSAELVQLLLEYGADTNVRDAGNNATPLHFAANHGSVEVVRVLLSAGADPHGQGDAHNLDVIGWATQFHPHRSPENAAAVLKLLLDADARHNIYSAIASGDVNAAREVLQANTAELDRRSIESDMTPLSWAISNRQYDIMDLLVQHGANLEQTNEHGRTVLTEAILNGNAEAVQRLRAAGAVEPVRPSVQAVRELYPTLVASVAKAVPMIPVSDIPATLEWYKALGFTEVGRYWENNELRWATLSLGTARLMLSAARSQGEPGLKLWFYTTQIDAVHALVEARQLELAHELLEGKRDRRSTIAFVRDINNTPYGSREFAIRDLNGYVLYFIQLPLEPVPVPPQG